MIKFEARERASWPVLLSLGKRNSKGKRCLEGADKAKTYLSRIEQGDDAIGLKYFHDRSANPFTRAAELLLVELVAWRKKGVWFGTITPWAKELLALGDLPMTRDNVQAWWSVAKRWMDEQWAQDPELFKPLIESCKSKGKSLAGERHDLYPSEVRRTVIDLRLKAAFFALTKPDDL